MVIGTQTLHKRLNEIDRYVNGGPYLLGLGRTTEWLIDGFPPEVDPKVKIQEELIGYLRVSSVVPVIENTYLNTAGSKIDNRYWNPAKGLELEYCDHLMFRASLEHNQLPSGNFRSIGLYENVEGDIQSLEFILPNASIKGDLISLAHTSPITKVSDAVQLIEFLVGI